MIQLYPGDRECSWVSFSHWNKSTWKQYIRILLCFCFLSFLPFSPLLVLVEGSECGTHTLCMLRKYPTTELYPQPKYISSETLSQDSGVVHGLGQGGAPDLQSHNSDTYYGIGVEPTHLSCMGICITGFLWVP